MLWIPEIDKKTDNNKGKEENKTAIENVCFNKISIKFELKFVLLLLQSHRNVLNSYDLFLLLPSSDCGDYAIRMRLPLSVKLTPRHE